MAAVVPTAVKADPRVPREVRADHRHGFMGEEDDFPPDFPDGGVQCLSCGHWYAAPAEDVPDRLRAAVFHQDREGEAPRRGRRFGSPTKLGR